MSAFTAYLIGTTIFTVGLAIGAHLLGVPPVWIGTGILIVIGMGIVGASTRTKTKTSSKN